MLNNAFRLGTWGLMAGRRMIFHDRFVREVEGLAVNEKGCSAAAAAEKSQRKTPAANTPAL
jgi:hypothetical protein